MNRRKSMRCKSVAEEAPVDENVYKNMLETMMNDPSKKVILKKLMKADKDTVDKYKQGTISSPLNRIKGKFNPESPTAQFRRRLLENNERSESATSTADLPVLPFNKLLDGVKAYVEIRNNKEDRSAGVKALMESMGAEIMNRLSSQTTHVIYKEGSYETYRRAKAMNKHVVSVLWLQSLKNLRKRLPESDFPAIGIVSSNTTDICEYIHSNYADIIKEEQNKMVSEPKKKRSKSVTASSNRCAVSLKSKKTSSTKLTESSDNSSCLLDDSNSVVPDTSKISSVSGDSVICETPSPSVKNRRRTRMLYNDNLSKLIEESRPKSTSKMSRKSVSVPSAKKLCRQTLFEVSNKSGASDADLDSKDSSQSLEIGKFVTQRRKTRYSTLPKDDSLKNLSKGAISLTSDCSSTDLSTESKRNTHSTDEFCLSLGVSSNSTDRDMSQVECKMLSMALKNEIKEEYNGVTFSSDESLSLKVSVDSDTEPYSLSNKDNFSLRVSSNNGNDLFIGKLEAALQKKEFKDSTAESFSLKVSSDNNQSLLDQSSSIGLAEEISQALCIINKDFESNLSQKSECDDQSDCPENNATSCDSAEGESSTDRDNQVEIANFPPVRKSLRIRKLREETTSGEVNGSTQNGDGVKKRRRKLYNPDGTLKEYFKDNEPEITKEVPKNKNASVTFKKPEPVDLLPIILTQNAKLAMESGKSCSEDESAAMSADESLPIKPILNRRSTMDFVQIQKLPKTRRAVQSVKKPTIVCSRFHRNEVTEFKEIVERLGGFTVENTVSKNTTHLVLGDCSRTINVVKGMARGIWILKSAWLHSSLERGRWLPEEPFEYLELNKNIQICRREREAFGSSYSMDIFMNCGEIFVTNTTNPISQQLKELIRLCKGVVFNCRRNAKIIVGVDASGCNENALCVRETWVLDSIYQNCCKNPALYAIPSVDK